MGKCVHTAVINAPVDQVWQLLRNFHDVSWITRFESKDDGATQEFCDPFYIAFLGHLKAHFA